MLCSLPVSSPIFINCIALPWKSNGASLRGVRERNWISLVFYCRYSDLFLASVLAFVRRFLLLRPRHTMRQIAATSRLVCTAAATSRLRLVCRCDMSHKFKPVWICATDRSDNDFHMSHEAICCSNLSRRRVAAICPIVCLGLYLSS